MRVLVTGSAGLIGRAVVAELARAGHETVGFDRADTPRHEIGSRSFPAHAASLAPCAAVVHCAAVLPSEPLDTRLGLANCVGTQQVLALATDWRVSRFVFISSIGVIGRPRILPVTEEHPLAPPTPYHASKLFGELAVAASGLPAAILRLTAPIGTGMPPTRLLSLFIRHALEGRPLPVDGAGTRRQNYVDVRDVAAAVRLCLDRTATGVFNIAGPAAISNRELAQVCVRALGSTSTVIASGRPDPEDDVSWDIAIDRAREQLGYEPTRALEDSIAAIAAGLPKGD